MKAKNSTVDAAEVERFSQMAGEWWNPQGSFKPLHQINPLRIGWIRGQAQAHFGRDSLQGLRLLDIGCGGGLICEPMARLGATVTGIDASEKNIAAAKLHAEKSALNIDYRCLPAEDLLAEGDAYDIVLALEIVEHVADVEAFVAATCGLVKPGGLIIYSTLNRTMKSFALAIVGAEYVLRWLPRGTHSWEKFLRPHELAAHLRESGIDVKEMTGLVMNPITWKWQLNPRDLDVNYLLAGTKP
jgi:2-polyprenyl-6-hydroxyphenyl methylase / 3-demethylubiquinone-9 3-methyltransferase